MPALTSDIILDWVHDDGSSLSETGWIRPQDHAFYLEVPAEKDGLTPRWRQGI